MKMKTSERGQTLVLVVFCLVALMGFAAIAVDGGHTYSEQRRAQSAADAAAYASARAASEGESWQTAGLNQLVLNDFDDADRLPNPGNPMDVMIYHPPVDGPYSAAEIQNGGNPNEYYQVKIRLQVEKSFSQFIFPGLLEVAVQSVAKAQPVVAISMGNAMHATNLDACKAVWFDGGGDTSVDGGNVFSNSAAVGNCASGQQNGSGSVSVTNGEIQVVGSWRQVGGAGDVSPNPDEGAADGVYHASLPNVPTPVCEGLASRTTSSHALEPGIYDGISIHNGSWTMAPGMYCLTDNFVVNGGELRGNNVLIVMLSGNVDMSGNADISLIRPNSILDQAGSQFGGMLLFMPADNHGGIDLGGNSGASYAGTIYAPGPRDSNKSKCTFGGSSGSIGINSNIVCNTIQVHGGADVVIKYKEQQNYRLPPMIELTQ